MSEPLYPYVRALAEKSPTVSVAVILTTDGLMLCGYEIGGRGLELARESPGGLAVALVTMLRDWATARGERVVPDP